MINILTTVGDIYGTYFECGGTELPYYLSYFGNNCVKFVKILVPVILIVLGMIDMFKAFSSQKEDEMKKAQQTFVKRLISGALVFLVVTSVQFLFSILSSAGFGSGFTDCMDQIINGTAQRKKDLSVPDITLDVEDFTPNDVKLTIVYGDGTQKEIGCSNSVGPLCEIFFSYDFASTPIGDWIPIDATDFTEEEGDKNPEQKLFSSTAGDFSYKPLGTYNMSKGSTDGAIDLTVDKTIYACYKKQQADGTYLYKCGNLN